MKGLNKLGTILTLVFALCLLALTLEVIYLLLRRRIFRKRSLDAEDGQQGQVISTPSSKELRCFLCWKKKTRIEPNADQQVQPQTGEEQEEEEEVDEIARWEKLYGLFTIKEEIEDDDDSAVAKKETIIAVKDDTTPFWTPCGSPTYYTPSPSPSHYVDDLCMPAPADG